MHNALCILAINMSILKSLNLTRRYKQGFTIVELIVVIVVIGIVAGIAVVGYGAWRDSIATKAVKSDLEIVKASMTSTQTFSENGFSTSLPSSFESGDNVEVTYISGNSTEYCIEAKSTLVESVLWRIEGKVSSAVIAKGACPPGDGWKAVASTNDSSCGVSLVNTIYCWGVGNLTPTPLGNGAIPSGAIISSISGGTGHFCVIADEWAYCWGTNSNGRLGDGTSNVQATPVAIMRGLIPTGKTLADVAAGGNHTCALTTDSLVYCWGYGVYGSLGRNTVVSSNTAVATVAGNIPVGVTPKAISAGGYNTCVLGTNNKAYCWGAGADGEIGNGGNTQMNSPTLVSQGAVPVSATLASIGVGSNHSCVTTTAGLAYCWGAGFNGRLGNGDSADSNVPVAVTQGSITYSKLWIGVGETCTLTSAGVGYCWGVNGDGQLGGGSSYTSSSFVNVPVLVQNGAKPSTIAFTEIKPGDTHACGLASNKKIYCWGSGANGKLGNGSSTSSSIPVAVTDSF